MRAQAIDYSILFLVLFLVGFGLVILYSTSSYKGSLLHNDTAYWLKKQAFFAVIGIAGMMIISRLDYHIWKKKWWFIWAVCNWSRKSWLKAMAATWSDQFSAIRACKDYIELVSSCIYKQQGETDAHRERTSGTVSSCTSDRRHRRY